VQRFRSVRSAIDALKGNYDPAIRVAAATFLGQFKDRASYMALLDALDIRSLEIAFAAAKALGERPDAKMRDEIARKKQETVKRLTERLQEELLYPDRREILKKLGDFRDNRSYKALVSALDDNEFSIAAAAAAALAKRRQFRATRPLTERLYLAIREKDYSRSSLFIEALGDLGDPRAVAVLIESLRHAKLLDDSFRKKLPRLKARVRDGPLLRPEIEKAIAKLGNAAVAPLIRALDHQESEVRDGAVSALTLLAPAATESLIQALRSGSPVTRFGAAVALGGTGSEEVGAALIEAATRDVEAPVAAAAARSLGGSRCPEALVVLADLTTRSETLVRVAAAAALGLLGGVGAAAPLAMMLGDADREVRHQAERSLVHVGSYAIGAMEQLLGHENAGVADAAARVLGETGTAALGPLLDNLAAADTRRRRSAAFALGLICGSDAALELSSRSLPLGRDDLSRSILGLRAALSDEDSHVRSRAAEGLGRLVAVTPRCVDEGIDDAEALADLCSSVFSLVLQRLDDPSHRVRAAAAAALGTMGRPEAAGELLRVLARHGETARLSAAQALMRVQTTDDVRSVLAAITHLEPQVRLTTAVAIQRYVSRATIEDRWFDWLRFPLRGWFHLEKDDVRVYVSDGIRRVTHALSHAAAQEQDAEIRNAALQALEAIRSAIRIKREHGTQTIHYSRRVVPVSELEQETDAEIAIHESVARVAEKIDDVPLGEPNRFTDVALYESFVYAPEDLIHAHKLADSESLIVGHDYTLEVAIRLNRTGIASAGVSSFAVLNPREAQETLTIIAVGRVTFGPLEIENPVVSLTWDYCQDSSPAYLRLQLQKLDRPSASSEIEVRLYHSNLDLLDVIRLTVTIATDGQAAPSGSTLRWFHDVGAIPAIEPDAALRAVNIGVAPKTHGYQFTFLFLRGDKRPEFPFVRHISTGDLQSLLRRSRDFWTRAAITAYAKKIIVSKQTWQRHLTELREIGFRAWMLLFGDAGANVRGAAEEVGQLIRSLSIEQNTHIQVSYDEGLTDFVFPWALLYPPEETDAVNPNQFWGARFEIEQVWNGRTKDNLDTEPISIAAALDTKFGQTDAQQKMFKGFLSVAGDRLTVRDDLNDRKALLQAFRSVPASHLYYFFCHGYAPAGPSVLQPDGVQLLTKAINDSPAGTRAVWQTLLTLTALMKDEAWIFLGDSEVTESQLGLAADYFRARRPVVFMNMCHSAALAPSMTSGLVRLFLRRSAAAVIGTEAPMTSVFAHAFAEQFFAHLLNNDSIGTAMLKARRHFLNHEMRNPLGLAYSLYGRATVKIGATGIIPLKAEGC
jgi:HEAT repeat protein